MRGIWILIAFFLTFTVASLLIPSPMFPGNIICTLIGKEANQFINYLSAFFNGAFYGGILWLVFVAISKRLEEEK